LIPFSSFQTKTASLFTQKNNKAACPAQKQACWGFKMRRQDMNNIQSSLGLGPPNTLLKQKKVPQP
jgi:hypothetical protein